MWKIYTFAVFLWACSPRQAPKPTVQGPDNDQENRPKVGQMDDGDRSRGLPQSPYDPQGAYNGRKGMAELIYEWDLVTDRSFVPELVPIRTGDAS